MPALRRLDALLAQLFATVQTRGGAGMAALQGLYVSPEDVERLLVPDASAALFGGHRPLFDVSEEPAGFARLRQQLGLDAFDLDMILVALAPELDLRYERLYGFLQDDVTRRRATVDLALSLRTSSAEEKTARLVHFAPGAPLIRHAVIHLVADPAHVQPPLLANYLKLDQQIIDIVLGRADLDSRLAPFCRLYDARPDLERLPLKPDAVRALRTLVRRAHDLGKPLTLFFHGPRGAGQSAVAEALAGQNALKLLHADLSRNGESENEADATVDLLLREARLQDAVLFVEGADGSRHEPWTHSQGKLREAGIVILAGAQAWPANDTDVVTVEFGALDFGLRRACWQGGLSDLGVSLAEAELDDLAGRFRLTAGQIGKAVMNARNRAVWRAAARGAPLAG
ncbi:MAG: hypothetical protein WCE79_13030, partial [Xanthobacteraceae bacterium]